MEHLKELEKIVRGLDENTLAYEVNNVIVWDLGYGRAKVQLWYSKDNTKELVASADVFLSQLSEYWQVELSKPYNRKEYWITNK